MRIWIYSNQTYARVQNKPITLYLETKNVLVYLSSCIPVLIAFKIHLRRAAQNLECLNSQIAS